MADINLLPEELRNKEKKELEASGKQSKRSDIKMSQPRLEPAGAKPPVKPARPFWSRLFGGQPKPAKPVLPAVVAKPILEKKAPVVEPITFSPRVAPVDPPPVSKPRPLPPPPVRPAGPTPAVPPTVNAPVVKPAAIKAKTKHSFHLFSHQKPPPTGNRPTPAAEPLMSVGEAGPNETELDINLIPKGFVGHERPDLSKRLLKSGVVIIMAFAVVGAAYLGIVWYKLQVNSEVNNLDGEIKQLESQIASRQADKAQATSLQQRLKLMNSLLTSHVYWTQWFKLLEQYTIDDVYYTNFSMAGTEKVTLTAVGRDYDSVARQLVAFQQAREVVKDVEVNAALAKLNDDGSYQQVDFTINLTLNPDVFRRSVR